MEEKYAVIAVGYNRPLSLARLLQSLQAAEYDGNKVDLIISIDYSGNDSTKAIAEKCEWPFGRKIIRAFEKRQGLRNHILACGDMTEHYDAVAVFEDDIVVAPGFYLFLKQTVKYYSENPCIAGISLYSRRWNEITDRIFEPENSGADVYFFQLAQSWGQIWTKAQWAAFRAWYDINKENTIPDGMLPRYIKSWPSNSWLKFYIWYCVDQKKYFVYPYTSLTTNFMEKGEHSYGNCSSRCQVVMQTGIIREYRLIPFTESAVCYDVFFENESVAKWLGLPKDEVCIDLYGSKETVEGYNYWLTARQESLPVLKTFGLQRRPMEENIKQNQAGDYFKLYQLPSGYEMPLPKPRKKGLELLDYDIRGEGVRPRNIFLWCWGCLLKGIHPPKKKDKPVR